MLFQNSFTYCLLLLLSQPFTTSISASRKSLINQVCAVFIAEILTANVLQYIDIGGQIQRHYFAPRATDQEKMNMCFRGTPYDLAERYTVRKFPTTSFCIYLYMFFYLLSYYNVCFLDYPPPPLSLLNLGIANLQKPD
jgi:hypothetical protein